MKMIYKFSIDQKRTKINFKWTKNSGRQNNSGKNNFEQTFPGKLILMEILKIWMEIF